MIGMTWYQAAQYCNWLSEVEGLPESEWCYPKAIKEGMKPLPNYLLKNGYRLATEAEWECACRAGSEDIRYYGSSINLLGNYCHYLENARDRPWPVGQKRPNDRGLFDMQGNVWTWVYDPGDYYAEDYAIVDNEDKKDINSNINRVMRGGSFVNRPLDIRSSLRSNNRPDQGLVTTGLRLARTYP
jgi:formylglycine-generating enzyme required for sulfatase activity